MTWFIDQFAAQFDAASFLLGLIAGIALTVFLLVLAVRHPDRP